MVRGCFVVLHFGNLSIFPFLGWPMTLLAYFCFLCADTICAPFLLRVEHIQVTILRP